MMLSDNDFSMYEYIRSHASEIVWIVVLLVGGHAGLKYVVRRIKKAADDNDPRSHTGKEKRARTLGRLLTTAGTIVIWGVAGLMVLRLFGVNTTPLLAASGIIGATVALGTQGFAKDLVSGAIIFTENQYAEGDEVRIGEFEGVVERMTVRSTVLRDGDGNLVFLANGNVNNVVNLSLGRK